MATSSRKKAIELWQSEIPVGDPESLAKTLFCVENPPGTERVSGSQDQLGILMPGLNKLNYDNGYWPVSIESVLDDTVLDFVEKNLWLLQLPQREDQYDVFAEQNINLESIRKLSESTEAVWQAILNKDAAAWGANTKKCFEAQLEMFPYMITEDAREAIRNYQDLAYGWKLTGAGGGGYLCLISDKEIPNAIQIRIRKK
jgi:galactokinase/mevalonate kinase-like predicted kinase